MDKNMLEALAWVDTLAKKRRLTNRQHEDATVSVCRHYSMFDNGEVLPKRIARLAVRSAINRTRPTV